MSTPKTEDAAAAAYGSYQAGGTGAPPPAPAQAAQDAAYASRLQQEEYLRAQGVQPGMAAATAQPVQATDGTQYIAFYGVEPGLPAGGMMAPHEQKLMEAFSLGRMIRILAVLDGIILFLNCIYFPVLFLFLVWAPVSGWLAGSRFSTGWTYVYAGYYIIRLSMDLAYIFSGYWWFILIFGVNLIIARFILRFAQILNSCSAAEREQLRNPATVWSRAPPPVFTAV